NRGFFLCCKCSSHSKNLRNPMFSHNCCVDQLNLQSQTLFEPVWIGWNEQTAGLASGWWRDEILANSAIAGVYAKSDDGKSAI
ncbi:hypothetical protein L3W99_24365, partial [Escherichia coli]|nr:hypothetical protein [Escherichia coli]